MDEILTAVNSALNGCPMGCPYSFAVDTPSSDVCAFSGPYSAGLFTVQSIFGSFISTSNGKRYIGISLIDLFAGPDLAVTLLAQVTSASSATLVAWGTQPDGSDVQSLSGTVTLNADRMLLSVRPTTPPFTLATWPFTAYAGRYVGKTIGGSAAADSLGFSPNDLQPDLRARTEGLLNHLYSRQ